MYIHHLFLLRIVKIVLVHMARHHVVNKGGRLLAYIAPCIWHSCPCIPLKRISFFTYLPPTTTTMMPHQLAIQDPSFSPRSVTQSDASDSSSFPGLLTRFSELHVGSPPPPDIPPRPALVLHVHINDLPIELVGKIIVEHSKLEWYAPAVDQQVCRYWRTAALSTPQAWARIKFKGVRKFPSETAWRLWIDRAASAPLDIRIPVQRRRSRDEKAPEYMVSALLEKSDCIVSLDISGVRRSFFLTSFPVLRHLRIDGRRIKAPGPDLDPDPDPWYPPHGGGGGQFRVASMPALQSLALTSIPCEPFATPGVIPPLSELSLSYNAIWYPLVWHSHHTLTSLALHSCGRWAGGGEDEYHPIEFPNLLFLFLYGIRSFKPYITTPRLQTLHEASNLVLDSFPRPLPSLTECSVRAIPIQSTMVDANYYNDIPLIHVESLHSEFPNLVKLSLRARAKVTLAFFLELADYPACLPNLRLVEIENSRSEATFSDMEITVIEICLVRRSQGALSVPLRASFGEPGEIREIPLFLAGVCNYKLFLERC